jgi:hypothetical protein
MECPLYPLLFLQLVEGFSISILDAKICVIILGIGIGGWVHLSHFLFVDNVLLFSNGQDRKVRELLKILEIYDIAIGMELNVQKPTTYFSGLGDEDESRLVDLFPFKKFNFQEGFKYLGYSLNPNGYIKRDWGSLWEKVESHINVWCNIWL